MCSLRTSRPAAPVRGLLAVGIFCAVQMLGAACSHAHELWIETDPVAKAGQEQAVQICWGHSGHKETGDMLAGQQSKLTALVLGPGGRDTLPVALADGGLLARFTPAAAGCYVLGADLQTGIIDRDLHGIPAKTRIVMYAKSMTRVGNEQNGAAAPLGFDLEIVPVDVPDEPKPGDLVTVKVLHQGKPLGGKDVLVSAATSGPLPPSEDPRVQTPEWSSQAMADPKTGEATFPLIAGGQHLFRIRYIDETPGIYDGDRNDSSDFSHLRKGDTYERTMYVSTLTLQVRGR